LGTDFLQGRGLFGVVHRNTHNSRSGLFELMHLGDGGIDIRGFGRAHTLHNDGGTRPNLDFTNPDCTCRFSFQHAFNHFRGLVFHRHLDNGGTGVLFGVFLQPLLDLGYPLSRLFLVDFARVSLADDLIHKPLEKCLHTPPLAPLAYHEIDA